METEKIKIYLEQLRKKSGGILPPCVVVAAARPKRSPIHDQFEWDNSHAAEQYRLWQARQLIRLTITEVKSKKKDYDVRAYISLRTDRNSEGGYRLITDVLANDDLRSQMLADALAELNTFRAKYGQLAELAKVFAAVDDLKKVAV